MIFVMFNVINYAVRQKKEGEKQEAPFQGLPFLFPHLVDQISVTSTFPHPLSVLYV